MAYSVWLRRLACVLCREASATIRRHACSISYGSQSYGEVETLVLTASATARIEARLEFGGGTLTPAVCWHIEDLTSDGAAGGVQLVNGDLYRLSTADV